MSVIRTPNTVAPSASGVRWRVLALLMLASFASYVFRYNLSIASTAIMADFGLTEARFGWVLGAFALVYALSQFPAGVLADRYGARRVLTACLLAWSVLNVATAILPAPDRVPASLSLALLIGVRSLVGACHAPIYPLTGALVARWFPSGDHALPNGLSSAGLTLGTAATATVLTALLVTLGWRLGFVALTPLGLVLAALWWWYVRDTPAAHPSVNDAERRLIGGGQDSESTHVRSWRAVLCQPGVVWLTLSYFSMNYVFYQYFNWVNYYLVAERGFDAAMAGWLTSAQWLVAALGAIAGGLLCDRLSRRRGVLRGCRVPVTLGLTLCALCLGAAAFSSSPGPAMVLLAAAFLFNQLAEPAYWAAAIRLGGPNAGAACGVMNMGGNLVGFVNALLVPWLAARFGWSLALASGGLFALLGVGFFALVRRAD